MTVYKALNKSIKGAEAYTEKEKYGKESLVMAI